MRQYPFTNAKKIVATFAWGTEQVYSQQGFPGGAYASVRAYAGDCMFGLNTDPLTDADYASIDFAWYTGAGGALYIYESGAIAVSGLSWVAGDLLEILYWFDGANWAITYLKNGVPIRGVVGPAGGVTFFFDSSFYQGDSQFRDIRFGPNAGRVLGTFTPSSGIALTHGVFPQLCGAGYDIHLQSESQDADGNWQPHNTLQGVDWLTAFKYRGDADSNIVTGSLELARADRTFSMAPLVRGSIVNRNGANAYAPFLDAVRRVRVRNAIMPKGVAPYSGVGGNWASSGVTLNTTDAKINDGDTFNAAFHTDTAVAGATVLVDELVPVEFDHINIWQGSPGSVANWTLEGSFGSGWTFVRDNIIPKLPGRNTFYFPRSLYRLWRLRLTNTPGGGPWSNEVQLNRDWVEIFDGYMDKVTVSDRDSNTILAQCRDLGALLVDTDIEVIRQYGSSGGTPVETIIQSILDDNLGAGVVTLYTPVSPTWNLHEFSQKLTSVMDAIRTLAKQIGYEVRYLYDVNNVLRLTFYAPDRAKIVNDYALAPTVYTDITSLDVDGADVRNAWTVEYIDRATGNKLTAIATSAPSIAQYKRRPAKIAYGYSSNIDSATEAQKMVDAALADTSFPKALEVIDARYWPLVDIADVVTLIANGEHYDTDQQRAVVAWEHDLREGDGNTTLTTRGKPGGGYTTWMAMVGGILDGPSLIVMDTPGANPAANHSVSYSGLWDTIQLSINGAAWIVPGASPLVVTPNPAGGATKVYSFRAIKNGQIVTQAVSIEPPAPLPPQAIITHLNSEVDDTQWFLQVNAVVGSGGGGANLLWATFVKIGFAAEAPDSSGNATTLPFAYTVNRDPRSDKIIRVTVTDTLTGLTNTTRITVPSQRAEVNNTGHPWRTFPMSDGDYSARSPVSTGLSVHPLMVDSRSALVNTMFRTPTDTLDSIIDGGTYGKPTFTRLGYADRAGAAIDSGNVAVAAAIDFGRAYLGKYSTNFARSSSDATQIATIINRVTNTGHLDATIQDSRAATVNTMFRTPTDTLDSIIDGGTYGRSTYTRLGYADRAGSAIDSGNVVVAAGVDFARAYTGKHGGNIARDSVDATKINLVYQQLSNSGHAISTMQDSRAALINTLFRTSTDTLDSVLDGGTYLRPVGINASHLVTPSSTIGRGTYQAFNAGGQTLTTGTTPVQLTLDTAQFIFGTGVTRSGNQLIINDAIATAGTWVCVAQVGFAANATGDRHVEIRRNGAVIGQATVKAATAATLVPPVVAFTQVALSDAFDVYVWENSGGNLAIVIGGGATWFAMTHLW